MRTKKHEIEGQADPYKHWSYRMISALCGGLLGTGLGTAGVFLTGTNSIAIVIALLTTATVLGAMIGFRYPYAPEVLRLLVDWLK